MNIGQPIKELGDINYEPLRDKILSLSDKEWDDNAIRQETFDLHKNTSSLIMIFCDGWPELTITKESGWNHLAEIAMPMMEGIIENHYKPGGTIIRAMAAKLFAGQRITPHVDKHPSFHIAHRIHIPITTNAHVRFTLAGRPFQLQLGKAYEVNNQSTHSVMNRGKEDRITFIFDYMPEDIKSMAKNLKN